MPRLNERKLDAFRERVTIPVTVDTYKMLQQLSETRGERLTETARELIEQGIRAWIRREPAV